MIGNGTYSGKNIAGSYTKSENGSEITHVMGAFRRNVTVLVAFCDGGMVSKARP